MKTCRLIVAGVLVALVFPSGVGRPQENDAANDRTLKQLQAQAQQRAEPLRELLLAKQRLKSRQGVVTRPESPPAMRGVWPDPYAGCKIRVVRPDPNVDYKIVIVRPDPNVDYKIRNLYPGSHDLCMVPRSSPRKTVIIRPRPRHGETGPKLKRQGSGQE